jgi:hypothetical protein
VLPGVAFIRDLIETDFRGGSYIIGTGHHGLDDWAAWLSRETVLPLLIAHLDGICMKLQVARDGVQAMKLSSVDPQVVISAYRSGQTLRAIGDRFGIAHSAIWRILDRYAEPRRVPGQSGKPPSLPAQRTRDAAVIDAYRDGQSLPRISRSLGIGSTTAWKILVRHGKPRRTGRQCLMADGRRNADIVTAYRSGRTRQQLATEFGLSTQRIDQILHRHGAQGQSRSAA